METLKEQVEQKLEEKPLVKVILELQKSVENTLKFFETLDENDLPLNLKAFKQLKENVELLEGVFKVLDGLFELYKTEKLVRLFEELEIDAIKLHGRNFILTGRMYASVNKETPETVEKAFKWLNSNDLGALIKLDVNAKSLTSALNAKFEDENILPGEDDGFKIHTQKYIGVRKA